MIFSEGVQNQVAELRLPQAVTAYNTVSNFKEATQLLSGFLRGAPFDTVSTLLFASQFLPLGKILGGIGKFAGVSTGSLGPKVATELTELYGSAGGVGTKGISQFIGETAAALTGKAHGLVATEFKAAYHGLDGVLRDEATGLFYIVEAKGGAGALKGTQLGAEWIEKKVAKIVGESRDIVPDHVIEQLEDQLLSGDLRVMLTETPIVNGVVQPTSFWIKKAGEIGSTFF